jgi:hypothetical protein
VVRQVNDDKESDEMRWTRRTITIIGMAVAAVALLVGAGAAIAAGAASSDDELTRVAEGIRQKDAFATAVAKELGTTEAELEAAIAAAATSRIDAAERAGSLSPADADLLREAVASGDRMAMHIAQPADVAQELGVTEAELNAAYASVQKANALARIDQALADERITKEVADEMRARVEQATFPGFGAAGFGRGGHGGGHGMGGGMDGAMGGGPGGGMGPMGHHGGFGPLGDAPLSGSGSSTAPSGSTTTQTPAVAL